MAKVLMFMVFWLAACWSVVGEDGDAPSPLVVSKHIKIFGLSLGIPLGLESDENLRGVFFGGGWWNCYVSPQFHPA